MRKNKNTVTLVLMVSSLGLLLVLQGFWLRETYLSAEENFRKETNNLFRNTVMAMHDTLIQRSLQPLKGDSVFGHVRVRRSLSPNGLPFPADDSLVDFISITEHGKR